MQSQLNYLIVQQRRAELIQAAQRARFTADTTPQPARRLLDRIGRRIIFAGTRDATRNRVIA